jgi:predicted phosphodiesterase
MIQRLIGATVCGLVGLLALPTEPAQLLARPTRIALLADLHVTAMTNDDLVAAHARLHRAIDQVNAAGVDLVLIAGDLTEFGSPGELRRLQEHLRAFKPPVWVVPGNHDVGNKRFQGLTKPDSTSSWRVRLYESWLGRSYFARCRAGVRVIGLNSPILASGLPQERAMWTWLGQELAQPTSQPTLVLTHYPLFEERPDEPAHPYWNVDPEPRARLLATLAKAGVRAVLSGHLHRDLTNQFGQMLLLTTRPVSVGLPKGKQAEGWLLLTVPADGPIQLQPQTLPHELEELRPTNAPGRSRPASGRLQVELPGLQSARPRCPLSISDQAK